ncbi:hypothetical protein CYMTET_18594 [Cymbomonas tetramitiformis]|uniref:Uncharacterized protein n=1 Tax=Cymbomonas tetramitiformis TaxID=36881 RepID=A0AAE0L5R8_9CHLO|nr:hypothetical protein CYMTET_18594 [Cymbomonas tetramitiformis]
MTTNECTYNKSEEEANDSEGIKQARALFEGDNEKAAAIYAKGRHRQWAKTVRELALGDKELYFETAGDSKRLSKIVVDSWS